MAAMNEAVVGVLLAGGRARRMGGGDKCLRSLGGRSILARVIERAAPQVGALVLNVNGDPARFASFGLPTVADPLPGHAGPLAGVLAGMRWTGEHRPDVRWIATVPTDTPFLPLDLVARLQEARARLGAPLACAASGGRTHPVVGLWDTKLADTLERAMRLEEMRKIDRWTARFEVAVVDFEAEPVDPFFNTNRPEDLAEAERLSSEAG